MFPLAQKVDILIRGEPETDRFGNERPGKGVWRSVAVASWWVALLKYQGW